MSRDLRLYSIALAIMLMLWFGPVRADYGTCPALAIPVQLDDGDVWHSGNSVPDDGTDYRNLYPVSGTSVELTDGDSNNLWDCNIEAGAGTYYDGANHLWVLDDDLTCYFDGAGDFRANTIEY